MQVWRDQRWTYAEAAASIAGVAAFLRERGVGHGDRVMILAENSPRWLHVFGGILAVGAVAVPRGEDISEDELQYILEHSEAKLCFAGNARALARLPEGSLRIDGDQFPAPQTPDLESYQQAVQPHDLAVLLYTSGTTGRPKGVMLEHKNIAHNIRVLPPLVNMAAHDVWVSILPSWHTFELTVELCGFAVGGETVYSDKRRIKDDLKKHRPHFFASVPRIWESIHGGVTSAIAKKGKVLNALFQASVRGTRRWKSGNPLGLPMHLLGSVLFYRKLRDAVGGRLRCAISGGGFLPPHIDHFFNDVGIPLLIGYGLTETAPVVALRRPEDNVLGTIGRAVPETEIRIGPNNTVQVRGPQIMRGYYKEEELTNAVLDKDGWLDTGDIARLVDKGDLVFIGRAKETIVMSGGENVEPEPIENRLLQSPLVMQIMLVGQDRKTLGALVVPDPDAAPTAEQINAEVRSLTGPSGGFRSCESVSRTAMIAEPFTPENGLLTHTLKMRRNEIAKQYADEIDALYNR